MYAESLQPNRETKTAPWHVLLSCQKEKKGKGGHEILEDKGAEQERRGEAAGGRASTKGAKAEKRSVGTTAFFIVG